MYLFNIISGECCNKVEVYPPAITQVWNEQSPRFGTYIKHPDLLNGHFYYQSTFANGDYGIWYCSEEETPSEWWIGLNSERGQCRGYFYTKRQDKCIHSFGWDWKYWKWNYYDGSTWKWAEEGLGLRCVDEEVHTC